MEKWTLHPNGIETIEKNLLYEALSQAQAELPVVQPNRKAYKNEYADLYGLFHNTYPILRQYGLSITPWAGVIDGIQLNGARLAHKSGQYQTNVYIFEADPVKNPNDQPSHKKQGALTYFNRNSCKDILGLLITDDPEDYDGQKEEPMKVYHTQAYITQDQFDQVTHTLKNYPDIQKRLLKGYDIKCLSQLPKVDFIKIMERIREQQIALENSQN